MEEDNLIPEDLGDEESEESGRLEVTDTTVTDRDILRLARQILLWSALILLLTFTTSLLSRLYNLDFVTDSLLYPVFELCKTVILLIIGFYFASKVQQTS